MRATRHEGIGARELVVKLVPEWAVDPTQFLARVELVEALAVRDDRVVSSVALGGATIHRIDGWLAVAYPWIEGRSLDVTNRFDVERMGRSLARLHQSLLLISADLPPLRPLQLVADANRKMPDSYQLLHGDFSSTNLLLDADMRLWILDFDECGYGPIEFELGNTLFMVLFGTSQRFDRPSPEYLQFRKWFVDSYAAAANGTVDRATIDWAISVRNAALVYWIDHLDEAPLGIRAASPEWQQHLRSFAG